MNFSLIVKAEMLKQFKNRTFLWIQPIVLVLILLPMLFLNWALEGEVYLSPEFYWDTFMVMSSVIAKIALPFILIVMITSEFSYHTIRQEIADGHQYKHIIGGKGVFWAALVTFWTLLSTVLVYLIGLLFIEDQSALSDSVTLLELAGKFWLEVFFTGVLAAFFALLFKKSGVSFIAFLAYLFLVENIIVLIFNNTLDIPEKYTAFFPTEALSAYMKFAFVQELQKQATDLPVTVAKTPLYIKVIGSIIYTFLINAWLYWKIDKTDIR